jgi:hypothetical protein
VIDSWKNFVVMMTKKNCVKKMKREIKNGVIKMKNEREKNWA